MPRRILLTGSRMWVDRDSMKAALWRQIELSVSVDGCFPLLVHGDCHGADRMADAMFREWKLPVEKHPANWAELGKPADPIRNQRMVDLGAHICLAFPMPDSRGTWDCVRRAREAGIPVEIVEAKEVK
jgi:hypothetical protein